MIIKGLYSYPIKSLRPIPLFGVVINPTGPLHDRVFMLIRPADTEDGKDENMQVSRYSQLCLFTQEFYPKGSDAENAEGVLVTYKPPERPRGESKDERAKNGVLLSKERRVLRVPFQPDTKGLARRKVVMHSAGCMAYDMGDAPYSEFFTGCLGIPVRLLYMDPADLRTPLGNMAPSPLKNDTGAGGILSWLGSRLGSGGEQTEDHADKYGITFADCAPLLFTTEWSLEDVSRRFKHQPELDSMIRRGMDMTKFRPNIVLGPRHGSPHESDDVITAWDEDFWAELAIYPQYPLLDHQDEPKCHKILLTQNCARCRAINVEYDSGEFGDVNLPGGEEPLKYLMQDRRVDPGTKWSPVFGRYGFLEERKPIKLFVGDRVEVVRRNEERTTFYWPGLSTNLAN